MIRKGLAGGSFKPLTEDSISRVHQTAMRIIEEVGFQVNSPAALEAFIEDRRPELYGVITKLNPNRG